MFLEEFPIGLGVPRVVENGFGGVCYMKGSLHEGGDFVYFERSIALASAAVRLSGSAGRQ